MNLSEFSDMVYDAIEELGLDPEGDPEDTEKVEIVTQTLDGTVYLTLIYEGEEVSIPMTSDTVFLPILH